MKSFGLTSGSAIALGLSLLASTAAAQDAALTSGTPDAAETTGGAADGDIVVTAQKRSERLQDVPIAITALSAEGIESAGVTSTLELGKVTPGLVTAQASGFYNPYIRGIGSRVLGPGNEPTVANYIDGVYMIDKQGLLQGGFSDIESVQILRGPQGTLFGRNATAGAILVTTKGPSDEWRANVEGTYGTDEKGGRLFISGPLAPTLSMSVAGFYRYQDGYIRNLNPANGAGARTGQAENFGIRGKIRWEPTDNFYAVLAADYVEGKESGPFAIQAIKGEGLVTAEATAIATGVAIPDIRNQRLVYAGEIDPFINAKGIGQSLTLNWSFDAFDVKSITAHRTDHNFTALDLDASPLPLTFLDTESKSNVWQQEINISSQKKSSLSWLLGAYYLHYKDGWERISTVSGVPYPFSLEKLATRPTTASSNDQRANVTTRSIGLFGEARYEFTPSTGITLGLRYTDEKLTLGQDSVSVTTVPNGTGGVTVRPPVTFQGLCAVTVGCTGLTSSFSELTYRAVATHKFGEDSMVYGSYNRGFKSGIYNLSRVAADNLAATKPETVDAFELGLKSSFLDRRLTLNAAVYLNNYKNMQVSTTAPGSVLQRSQNAAKARTSGIEIETRFRASDRLTLQAAFAHFFEAEYVSFPSCSVYTPRVPPAGGNVVTSADCSGKRLPFTPPTTVNFSFDYEIPLSSGSITLNGLYSYQGRHDTGTFSSEVTRVPRQDPINTVNLSATWSSQNDNLFVKIWGRDMINEKDIFRGVYQTGFGFNTAYTRGSTYGVTIGANY